MDMLEFFYENRPKRLKLHPRKLKLPEKNLFLQGVRFCGKYSLLMQHIKPTSLFIDAKDPRFDATFYNKRIDSFLAQKNLDHLIIYNYTKDLRLPLHTRVTLSSHDIEDNPNLELLRLYPLDFEEFILFAKPHHDIKIVFNNYLKSGTMPELAQLDEIAKARRYQEMLHLLFCNDLLAFKEIVSFQSTPASIHFIYSRIKQKCKISKDRLYSLFHSLVANSYIYPIDKLNAKRSPAKLYFFDFTIKNNFYPQKEFPKTFENMVFWQIKDRNLAYLEPLGLYELDEDILILPIPFGNEAKIEEKITKILSKNKIAPKKIEVVSVGSDFQYEHKSIFCEVVPFYRWALR